jgi:ketosteroid isomerase-like protein
MICDRTRFFGLRPTGSRPSDPLPRGAAGLEVTDSEIRALCHRFFDAIEARDVETIAGLYRNDLAFWFNVTGHAATKTENLAALTSGYDRHRQRRYSDRIVNTFRGGFVMQYTLNISHHDGHETALFPCVVVLCRDGKITRIDEYIDSGKFAVPAHKTTAG